MPGKDLTFPGRRSLDITNRLQEVNGAYIDLKALYEGGSQNRQDRAEYTGIMVANGDRASVVVRCNLWDDNDSPTVNLPLACNVVHPLRVRRVYSESTTPGTTVILFGQ